MGLFTNRKSFIIKSLALTVTALMVNTAQAADNSEIQQLRNEVQELKALLQQQQQQVRLVESKVQAAPVVANSSPSLLSKAGANVNLYGFVRADAEYQFKGSPNGIFNDINKVDLSGNKANEDKLYGTAATSRIGLDFKAPVQGADVGGKVEIDFRGSGDTVRIRHAYLNYNNWLFGQTTSSFLSTETQPEMIDFNSPLGIGTKRTPMVRYSDKIDANTQYFVGLEKGRDENRLPAATGKISHKFGDSALVTGRALVQEVRGRAADDATEFGWGVGLGANIKVTDQLVLNADYSHVKGDNFYLLYTDNPYQQKSADDIDLTDFDAVTLGATYKITPKLRSTLGYGAVFYDDSTLGNAANEKLQQGWLNVMYSPVKPITFGTEYVYGERETVGGAKGRDSRLGVMAKYDF